MLSCKNWGGLPGSQAGMVSTVLPSANTRVNSGNTSSYTPWLTASNTWGQAKCKQGTVGVGEVEREVEVEVEVEPACVRLHHAPQAAEGSGMTS